MLVVQKYGGTSVADVERIKNVAKRIIKYREEDNDIVVVVSAMAGETDRLLNLAHSASKTPDEREIDVLISTGEQVTSALLAMTLKNMFCEAVSILGHQAKIITDSSYTKARIAHIEKHQIMSEINKGRVVVVPGFQGVDEKGNITTLGRGGSDTSAVALAAALNADVCEIYTDVDGVYTADPNFVPKARKIKEISHDEIAEMAILGAKILYYRAIDIARNHRVNILVKQSFHNGNGTVVKTREEIPMLEKVHVRAVTHEINVGKIILKDVPDIPGIAARLFKALANKEIVVDMIIQSAEHDKVNDIAFTVALGDLDRAIKITKEVAKEIGSPKVFFDKEVAKISIVGAGITSDPLIAARMFEALANNHINIDMISTSGMRISCIIHQDHIVDAVRAVHNEFQLDEEGDVNEIL